MKYLKLFVIPVFLTGFLVLPYQSGAATTEELKAKISFLSKKVKNSQKSQLLNARVVPTVKIISPNGGESFSVNQKMPIRWNAKNVKSSDWFEIYLIDASSTEKSRKIASHIPFFKKSHSWNIPRSVKEGDYLIKINLCQKMSGKTKGLLEGEIRICLGKINDKSDAAFSITNPDSVDARYFQYTIPLSNPNGTAAGDDNLRNDESFIVKITDPAVIQQALDDLNGERQLIVSGIVNSDNGGFNSPWSWHLNPATIELGENFTEICDATLSYIENNLSDWLGQQYCPWSLRVNAVYDAPPTSSISPISSVQVHRANILNIRENGSLSAKKIGFARGGEVLKKLEEKDDWVKIELSDGKIGWVFGQYVISIIAID